MSADAGRVDIDRQGVGIANHKVLLASRNIEPGKKRVDGRQLNRKHVAGWRLFGKIEPDHGLLRFRLARGLEVILNHEVRTLRDMQRETLREKMGLRAYRPAAEWHGSASRAHAAETGLRAFARFEMRAAVR